MIVDRPRGLWPSLPPRPFHEFDAVALERVFRACLSFVVVGREAF